MLKQGTSNWLGDDEKMRSQKNIKLRLIKSSLNYYFFEQLIVN